MGIALTVAPAPVPRACVLRLVPRQRMSESPHGAQHEARPATVPVPVLHHVHVDDVAVSGLVAALREELSEAG